MQLTSEQQQQISSLIREGYNNYTNSETSYTKYSILYSIIDMKCSLGDYKIYRDLKRCIKHHVESADEQDFGYDLITIDKITEFSTLLPLHEQQAILKSFSRVLEEHGYEEEKESIGILLKQLSLKIMAGDRFHLANPLYYASVVSVKGPLFIIIIITLLFLVESIFLLPAPNSSLALFEFKPHAYTSNNYINTLVSVPIMILSVDEDIKVKPLTLLGAIILVIAKAFFATVVLGFLVKKVEEKNKI